MPSAPPRISAATQRSAFLLSLATFSSMATQRICDAMLPALSNIFQTSVAQAAQVIWVFAVVYGLAQLFYGPLGDRTGKFRIITYATLGCSVASLVAAFAVTGRLIVALSGPLRGRHRPALRRAPKGTMSLQDTRFTGGKEAAKIIPNRAP